VAEAAHRRLRRRRNLRFGDLDGDGRLDILVGQVVHHGPSDRHSELGA
jgi:hypothetical protein